MKVLITGAGGQLGWELRRSAPSGSLIYALTKDKLDVTNRAQVETRLRELRPDIVINAAAYTAVDLAEKEPEQAYAVNAAGAENLARVRAVRVHRKNLEVAIAVSMERDLAVYPWESGMRSMRVSDGTCQWYGNCTCQQYQGNKC